MKFVMRDLWLTRKNLGRIKRVHPFPTILRSQLQNFVELSLHDNLYAYNVQVGINRICA